MLRMTLRIGCAIWLLGVPVLAAGDDNMDFGDGIYDVKEDTIASYDSIGDKDTNINFTIVEAISLAKKNRNIDAGQSDDDDLTNFNDGLIDNNQNSIVVEAGSRVDKVVNVIIQK